MIRCTFKLNSQEMSVLSCPGVGYFRAYSGFAGATRNNPEDITEKSVGPLPIGRYFIVSRPEGGRLGPLRDFTSSVLSGSNRFVWFALFRDDGRIDDVTFVNKVERGNFRLHPAGYKGVSEGCITLPSRSEFEVLRRALLRTRAEKITTSLTAFGTIQVY